MDQKSQVVQQHHFTKDASEVLGEEGVLQESQLVGDELEPEPRTSDSHLSTYFIHYIILNIGYK